MLTRKKIRAGHGAWPRKDGTSPMDPVVIGVGTLLAQSIERYTGRNGAVHLNEDVGGSPVAIDTGVAGRRGRLVAVFPSGRRPVDADSTYGRRIGLNKALAPGTEIELGSGTLFVEPSTAGDTEVGVKPDQERATNWLNPDALSNCYGQVVRLELHPKEGSTE